MNMGGRAVAGSIPLQKTVNIAAICIVSPCAAKGQNRINSAM
jgi:hypothetical protein